MKWIGTFLICVGLWCPSAWSQSCEMQVIFKETLFKSQQLFKIRFIEKNQEESFSSFLLAFKALGYYTKNGQCAFLKTTGGEVCSLSIDSPFQGGGITIKTKKRDLLRQISNQYSYSTNLKSMELLQKNLKVSAEQKSKVLWGFLYKAGLCNNYMLEKCEVRTIPHGYALFNETKRISFITTDFEEVTSLHQRLMSEGLCPQQIVQTPRRVNSSSI